MRGTPLARAEQSMGRGVHAAEVGADGERMRIKSANLRPLPLAVVGEGESEAGGAAESDGGILRDGGYAEEFVWVQMHQ